MTATELNSKPEDVKTSKLLTCAGGKARDVNFSFNFEDEDDAMELQPIMDKFDEYLNPKKDRTFIHHEFFS